MQELIADEEALFRLNQRQRQILNPAQGQYDQNIHQEHENVDEDVNQEILNPEQGQLVEYIRGDHENADERIVDDENAEDGVFDEILLNAAQGQNVENVHSDEENII